MKILLISATQKEQGNRALIRKIKSVHNEVDFLVTGVGMVKTTYFLSSYLSENKVDFVLNTGICGSFSRKFPVGTVVNVCSEEFGDLGYDNNGTFTPFSSGPKLRDNTIRVNNNAKNILSHLPCVNGITVNTASGEKNRILQLKKLFNPDVESMEGAAVFYTCLMRNIPFAGVRAVSNFVEPRNRAAWDIPLALKNLHAALPEIIGIIKTN